MNYYASLDENMTV